MLTKTPMPEPEEGKKLVVIRGTGGNDATNMEIREVDRSTDLMVFDSNGQLQTREGQYFGADKTGRRGYTYRMHVVMQQETAEFEAEEVSCGRTIREHRHRSSSLALACRRSPPLTPRCPTSPRLPSPSLPV